ncbi:MAG: exodeoxyribonuclease III [Aestuariivirga sp.]|uniref:exodeoxyribonuclease III n=1 Tax=Aestuariivirga sp. TaxID=2650926 RepID=UPI0038D17E14
MKIATWNVNSINARLDNALAWFSEAKPDVACLQELKCEDKAFPAQAFEDLGYHCLVHGQKTYNGVAILSRAMPEDVRRGLPGEDEDGQARYLEAVFPGKSGIVRVASIYLPNGNPLGTDKFTYKLRWMDRLHAHARALLKLEEPLVLAGDYNVIPSARDARNPEAWLGDALFSAEARAKFRTLLNLGLTDAIRQVHGDEPDLYTFWDYQAGAFKRNHGIRIDHLLLSPQAADRLKSARIDRDTRAQDHPSDHVPVMIELT